jgi:hypothetical protein
MNLDGKISLHSMLKPGALKKNGKVDLRLKKH